MAAILSRLQCVKGYRYISSIAPYNLAAVSSISMLWVNAVHLIVS